MSAYRWNYTEVILDPSPAFPAGQTVRRPVIPARLERNKFLSREFRGMLDTDCDYCLFPADLLPDLGLCADDLPRHSIHSVVAEEDAWFAWVNLVLVELGTCTLYAGFTESLRGNELFILGNNGFLGQFNIFFDPKNGVFEIDDYKA